MWQDRSTWWPSLHGRELSKIIWPEIASKPSKRIRPHKPKSQPILPDDPIDKLPDDPLLQPPVDPSVLAIRNSSKLTSSKHPQFAPPTQICPANFTYSNLLQNARIPVHQENVTQFSLQSNQRRSIDPRLPHVLARPPPLFPEVPGYPVPCPHSNLGLFFVQMDKASKLFPTGRKMKKASK